MEERELFERAVDRLQAELSRRFAQRDQPSDIFGPSTTPSYSTLDFDDAFTVIVRPSSPRSQNKANSAPRASKHHVVFDDESSFSAQNVRRSSTIKSPANDESNNASYNDENTSRNRNNNNNNNIMSRTPQPASRRSTSLRYSKTPPPPPPLDQLPPFISGAREGSFFADSVFHVQNAHSIRSRKLKEKKVELFMHKKNSVV